MDDGGWQRAGGRTALRDDGAPPRRRRAASGTGATAARALEQRDGTQLLGGAAAAQGRGSHALVAMEEDAALASALKPLFSRSMLVRLGFLAIGFSAIGPLALSYAEILPLPVGARVILLPAAVLAIILGVTNRYWGWRALVGYSAGIVATSIYDIVRLSLFELGFWDDPIPGIGQLLLDQSDPNLFAGYFWRLFGNGAGMGMAFAMLPWRGAWPGFLYGTAICLGLFAVLFFFPVAQTHFFPLLPHVAVGALIGHFVYGSVLGWLVAKRIPPPKLRARGRPRG